MKLLFEIGMEENPARFLVNALNDLKNNLAKKLKDERIDYQDIKTFGTPRRLVILVEGLAERQNDLNELNMGPAKKLLMDKMECFLKQDLDLLNLKE